MSATILRQAVMSRIAAANGIDPSEVNIGAKGALFYRRNDRLLCLCQEGSEYWNEVQAEVIAEQFIARARRSAKAS